MCLFEGVDIWQEIYLCAVEDILDREYLQAWIVFVPAGRSVEAFSGAASSSIGLVGGSSVK